MPRTTHAPQPTTDRAGAPTVADRGERELIARVRARLPHPPWLLVGAGDDAAVVEPPRGVLEAWTTDMLVDGVHFDRAFVPPAAIGHRALAANLSDLAAMGARPRAALLSLALPATLPLADFDALLDGLLALAARERIVVVGGNLTATPGPLSVDLCLTGTVRRRRVLTRAGARPGDEVYVTGTLGDAALGLARLRREPGTAADAAVERYLRPTARVRVGVQLGENRVASSCMDLSDGLADGVRQVAEASGVGIAIDGDALPASPGFAESAAALGLDPLVLALSGGDDYELMFTVRPRARGRLRRIRGRVGPLALTRVGVVTRERQLVLRTGGRTVALPEGHEHFGPAHRTTTPATPLDTTADDR